MTVELLDISFKLDSPFGGYFEGDYVAVYFSTDDNTFNVFVNAASTTSGNNIPANAWNYGHLSEFAFKEEFIHQNSICSGTDLLSFVRKDAFPYLTFNRLYNHPTCVVFDPDDPKVCDLIFDSLPVVTNATSSVATDGEITVLATSSNGIIKYKINAEFNNYDDGGQISGTFSNLSTGNYTVFAIDQSNCKASISVIVGVANTYGVLYRTQYYYKRDGVNLFHHVTDILQKDYTGDVTYVKAEGTPASYELRNDNEKEKFTPILVGNLVVNLQTDNDGDFRDLHTNDPNKFRIRHSINNSVVWIGPVEPSQSQESYISPPYNVSCKATDGLPRLGNVFLVDDLGNRLTGEFKQIILIAWILNKIGLGINIRSACNLYATGMNTSDSDDPLDQAYVDVERYYLINDNPTCWDVLTWLLTPYGAQIIQWGNVWNITRLEERVAMYDYREFDSNGIFVSNGSYDPIKDLKSSGNGNRICWIDRNQELFINPGFGKLNLIYDLGLKDTIILNGNFSVKRYSTLQADVGGNLAQTIGTIPDLRGFQLVNNGNVVSKRVEYLNNDNVALELKIANTQFYPPIPVGFMLSDIQVLKMGTSDALKISYRIKITPESTAITPYLIKARIKIIYGNYYVTSLGDWTTTDTDIRFYCGKDDFGQFKEFQLTTKNFVDVSYLSGQPFYIILYLSNIVDDPYDSIADLKNVDTTALPIGFNSEIFPSGGQLYIYELKNTTDADNSYSVVEPNDYDVSTNQVKWVQVWVGPATRILQAGPPKLSIDYIKIEYLSGGKNVPEIATLVQPMENDNSQELNKVIYHGSIIQNGDTYVTHIDYDRWLFRAGWYNFQYDIIKFKANSADLTYSGYLRNASGVGFTTWTRDGIAESASLQNIFGAMNAEQYNRSWFSLQGPFEGDIFFSPIDCMNETMDGNRKYVPSSLAIEFKNNIYDARFNEVSNIFLAASSELSAAEFNLDFNLDFTS